MSEYDGNVLQGEIAAAMRRRTESFTARRQIRAGQLVSGADPGPVEPTGDDDELWIGVAAHDAAPGEPVDVHRGGRRLLVATGMIAAGDLVIPAADGRVSRLPGIAPGRSILDTEVSAFELAAAVGTAYADAAHGDLVEVELIR